MAFTSCRIRDVSHATGQNLLILGRSDFGPVLATKSQYGRRCERSQRTNWRSPCRRHFARI